MKNTSMFQTLKNKKYITSISILVIAAFTVYSLPSLGKKRCPPIKVNKYEYNYTVRGKCYRVLKTSRAAHYHKKGVASWYGGMFHGRKAADGSTYNMYAMTGASKILPLGTKVRVKNLSNNKSIVVKITDRGPFVKGRIIDLSYAAAKKLGYQEKGITHVEVTTV